MDKIFFRVFALIICVFAFLILFHDRDDTASSSRPTYRQSSMSELGNAYIILPDMEVRVTLRDGKAEFPADPNIPDGVKGSVSLLPYTAKMDGSSGRGYVFGAVVVSGGGSGMFSYLLMFEDDGRRLGFVTAVPLGQVVITDLRAGEIMGADGEDFPVRVRILARDDGEENAAPPTISRVLVFRVHRSEGTITNEGEESHNASQSEIREQVPTEPPPPPHSGD